MSTRNSVYLERKAENLGQALGFFLGSNHKQSRTDRLLTFLDQIDFWDWEVEELIFSFKNFAERSEAFDTTHPGERAGSNGIMVKHSKAQVVQWDRRYDASLERTWGHVLGSTKTTVVVPIEALEATLKTWHEILTTAEKSVLASPEKVEAGVRAGVEGYQPDLTRFRKTTGSKPEPCP